MLSKKILSNFENEINNFFQVCPKEMIDKLQLHYNRSRQAAITSELIEIISGAESL